MQSADNSQKDDDKLEELNEGIFEISLFLVTAARGCVDEPYMYGPLRLLTAINRLASLYSRTDVISPDPFLVKASEEIDDNLSKVMSSEDEFVAFMDKMVIEFTDELKRRESGRG